jgi:hypothetical protein
MINTGLAGNVYDDFIDAFELSRDVEGSVFATDDGVHYPRIMYRAQLMMILHRIMKWDLSGGKPEGFSRKDASTVDKTSGKDYKELYEEALKEFNELSKNQLRGTPSTDKLASASDSNNVVADEEFREYYQST